MSMASNSGNMLVNNTEIVEKKVDIENALSRMRRPLDLTEINVEVYGIYSLPDQWKTKFDAPEEQLYQYELEVFGISLKQAKIFGRELTEEEKAEQEAAKNTKAKAPPAKPDPKKKEEEPNKEELERIEREKKEKEERLRKAQEEWDALDEETKFYRKSEDIYKEPCLKFHNNYAVKRIEQLKEQLTQLQDGDEQKKEIQDQISILQSEIYTGQMVTEKQGFELVEFEEQVSKEKGCWIRFNKLPPPEEEILDPKAAAAKKAPPKGGKGAPVEDMKPYFAKAWLSFEDLLQPGAIQTKQRVPLMTCPPLSKQLGTDGIERYQPMEDYDQIFEHNRTYVYIKVTLSEPVTPTIPEFPEPLPHEVVPVKQFIRWPFSKDPTDDFKKQITLAVESLAKEYYNMFQNELETEAKGQKSESEINESFEERKKEFLYEINTSGKYHILKEKLKKTIVRIVKEHFKKQGSIKGLYKDERDHFYSQLYAYLVQQMRTTVQSLVEKKRNELHENITIPQDQYIKERDHIAEVECEETLSEKYLRLAAEYENLYCSFPEAEQFMQKYLALFEGDPEKMQQMGQFYLRMGKLEKADEYLRDAYSFQIKNQQIALNYACFLLQLQNRNKEAAVILNKLADDQYELVMVNILLSIAYEQDNDPLMAQKFRAQAFVRKLRDLGEIPEIGELQYHPPVSQPPVKLQPGQLAQMQQQQEAMLAQVTKRQECQPAYHNKRLTQKQQDLVFLEIAERLYGAQLSVLAAKCIQQVQIQDQARYFKVMGYIMKQKGNYDEAINAFQWLVDKDQTDIEALAELGHCQFLAKKNEAEETYLKVIRLANFSQDKPIPDDYVLQRLGLVYIRMNDYDTAYEIFCENISKYPKSSFSHFYCGVCHMQAAQSYRRSSQRAYSVLQKANFLDPYRAEAWGWACLASIEKYTYNQAFMCMNEAIKLKLKDHELFNMMSQKFKSYGLNKDYSILCQEHCLRSRALKDSIRHQKKLDEFLKAIKGLTKIDEMKVKFKETLVKSNCLKEDDSMMNEYLTLLTGDETPLA